MPLFVGTSGWQYRSWRGVFYPTTLHPSRWLESYAERFATVESNAAFYRLPEGRVFAGWAERTPADFVMAVKASRYLTHVRRLREPEEPVWLLVERVAGLGAKLGPVLLQLPPSLPAQPERLRAALALFPATVRMAVEFRHESWYCDEVQAILAERGAALCLADRGGPLDPVWRTAPWAYVRFHEGRGFPPPSYERGDLARWAGLLAATWGPDADAFVYFNNDPGACAVRDAAVFAEVAAAAGLRPTRTPEAGSIHPYGG